jgi:hypothetical protein
MSQKQALGPRMRVLRRRDMGMVVYALSACGKLLKVRVRLLRLSDEVAHGLNERSRWAADERGV